jgi:elongation factor P hydroxylase
MITVQKYAACTGFWCGNLREKVHWVVSGRRREDNIKMDLQEVGYGGMDLIELA